MRKMLFGKSVLAGLIALGMSGVWVPSVHAVARTWVGNTDTNFATGANWSTAAFVSGDSMTFNAAGSSGTFLNNDLTADTSVAGMTFNSTAPSYTIGGNAIKLDGNIAIASGATNAQTIYLDMELTADRTFTTRTGGGDLTLAGNISGTGGLVKSNIAGTLTLSGNNTFTGNVVISNATGTAISVAQDANLGLGSTVIMAQNTKLLTTGTFATDKNFTFTGLNQTFEVSADTTFTINGMISGTSPTGSTPRKSGSGMLVLNAANYFTDESTFLVAAGGLGLGDADALDNTVLKFNGSTSLNNTSGGALAMDGHRGLILTSGFTFTGTDSLDLSAAMSGFTQTVGSTRTITVAANTLTLQGFQSTGTDPNGTALVEGGINKAGDGTLVFTTASDYTGVTTVSAGTLRLTGGNNQLNAASAITIAGGVLDLNGASLANSSTVTFQGGTFQNGTLNKSGANYDAQAGTVSAVLAGDVGLTKTTDGLVTLSGANTYTGGTTVSAGALVVDGSIAGGLIVDAGATLGGSGTVSGAATISGIHTPGNSPGLQTFESDLTYYDSSSVTWELTSNALGVRGTDYDGIDVGGDLTIYGTPAINLVFNGAGSAVDWTDVFWDSDHSWTFYDVAGSLTGLFTLGTVGQDIHGADTMGAFSISAAGSDVMINYVAAIPEPAVVSLMTLVGAGMFVRRRMRISVE